jgi:RNA polymerase sigma-70 factor (ECF subfamily)
MAFPFTKDGRDKDYENAINVLFEENYAKVYKKIASILYDVELAKDATQETFMRAFSKLDTLSDKSKFSPWVYAIAVNICNRMLKQKITYRNKNISIYDDEGNMLNISELVDFNVPDKIFENNEIRQELKQCIGELDVETQQIINMRFGNEFSIQEIAECLDLKEGTIKSRIYRAKRKIADELAKLIDRKGLNNGQGF